MEEKVTKQENLVHEDQSDIVTCQQCQEKELQQAKHELHKCRTANAAKDNEIKKKDKDRFILMCIVVGIGVLLGKEALDGINEWLESFNAVKGQIDHLSSANIPGPATVAVMGMGMASLRPRRK